MRVRGFTAFVLLLTVAFASPVFAGGDEDGDKDAALSLPASPTIQSAPKSQPAPINITARVEPEKTALGESVTVFAQVHHPPDVRVELFGFPEAPEFDVTPLSFETIKNPDGNLSVAKYRVQILNLNNDGKVLIPPARFKVFAKDLQGEILESPPLFVEVATLMPKEKAATAEIDDIVGFKELLRPFWGFIFALVGILLVGVAFLIYYAVMRIKPEVKKPSAPPPPPLPADEIALAKLKLIVSKEYLKRGDVESYYIEISEVVREFFGNLYKFDSVEMTSDELLETLAAIPTPGLDIRRLKSFLNHTDTVKFSELAPTAEECSQTLDDAYFFVMNCKPGDFAMPKPQLRESRWNSVTR